ncbi:hypothetical protein Cfla_0518 [Cellulomonas flavigena DSM 20109]|uniref:DUF7824 domain-containing protein n=1 Tax=Cellulomonas flavigena (strain ATCC 482 / DSM 20109 / BCRC 11376 / JCM 18109 / NBRC 3775 / NCIMB 8073 / NRS 134) TaxID=446466 RepID=D5UI08_CELFN|nr:DUF6493 family protein [Cellulomonas flavigena]ADG73432.1 hypothetical protein Cfla_0518 [Cellulomonas flavigena DSM 20109]
MSATPALLAAVEVFRVLGWADADRQDAPGLPVGTPEQQRVAREGLSRGDWGEWGQLDERTYGWKSWVDVDEWLLTLFAVRVGVDAARSARLLRARPVDDDLMTHLLAPRGPVFARTFVRAAYQPTRRAWEHSTTALAGPVVRLVDLHDLPVPDDVDYLRDWAVYAAGALTGEAGGDLYPATRGWAPPQSITRRLPEHVRAAVAAGVPATGPFGVVLPAAVEQGLVDRDEAVDLALAALDAATRPGDRKAWTQALTGTLAITDAEVVSRADALVPVLAHGEAPVVAAFAPRLVAGVDDGTLADVLVAALTVRTKAVLRTLLTAAAARPRPDAATREVVAPLVVPHATGPDRTLARAAQELVAAWELKVEEAPDDLHDDRVVRWRPTPPVWQVPRFDVGEVSGAALTAAAAALTGRPDEGTDVEVDRFLALANAVAATDRDTARTALGGVRATAVPGLASVAAWVAGTPGPWLDRARTGGLRDITYDPSDAREAAVLQRLGEVPVLLSTPTWVDLRIDPADLVERLRAYVSAAAVVSEADLQLAALRCDVALTTDETVAALEDLPVPVVLQSGALTARTAGPTLAAYLRDPLREPSLEVHGRRRHWQVGPTPVPAALRGLPPRLRTVDWLWRLDMAQHPTWGDAASSKVDAHGEPGSGLVLRQLARRAAPLTPGLAVNVIGALRNLHPAAVADATLAVREAWERGLLRPGVADVRLLGWEETPTQLAAFARVCRELADEGLLSVVWPLLDDLLQVAVAAPRLPPGTSDLAEAVRTLLPDVERAVTAGDAAPDVLALPGTRTLAARGGTSRAVVAARAVVDRLPAVAPDDAPAPVAPPAGPAFDDVWPADAGTRPAIEDGATVRATWVRRNASQRLLSLELTLPDGDTYRVLKTWYYDVTSEGQCAAQSPQAVAADGGVDAWLRWDPGSGRLVVAAHRNDAAGTNSPSELPRAPLSTALVAVLLAGGCGDDGQYHLHDAIGEGLLGSAGVRAAIRALLASPDVDPARLARLTVKDAATLPVLWPVLVEGVRHAAALPAAPRWLPRVLDAATHHAPLLREAAARGLLPADAATWPGLADLAARPATNAGARKARVLAAALGLADG